MKDVEKISQSVEHKDKVMENREMIRKLEAWSSRSNTWTIEVPERINSEHKEERNNSRKFPRTGEHELPN